MRDWAIISTFLAEVADALAERLAGEAALDHQLQRPFGGSDRAHAVVDPAGTEAHLGDLEAAALAEQHVLVGDADVVEPQVHVPVRGVVLAEHVHRAEDLDSGRVHRDENLRLTLVRRSVGAGLHHRDHDLAARVAGAGDVVLLAGDHPFVAVAHCLALDVLGIRRCDVGFGHRVGGTDLATQERLEPLRLLLGGTDALEHLHVAGVGCGAVHRLRGERVLAQLHRDVGVVEVVQSLTGLGVGEEEVPQTLLLRLVLDRLQQFELTLAVTPVVGAGPGRDGRTPP
jgi:hypothetical protein